MADGTQNKRLIARKITALFLLLGICIPLIMGALGDVEIIGDLKLTTAGKGIKLEPSSGDDVWIYPTYLSDIGGGISGLKIPCLGYGDSTFMTVNSDGEILFMSTASYDNTIGSGEEFTASASASSIPWKVNTTAAPTTEGEAVWDSDDDYLAVGDGSGTLKMISVRSLPPTSASGTGILGQMAFDSKYAYRAVATNTWKRVALATWTDENMLLENGDKMLLESGDFMLLE